MTPSTVLRPLFLSLALLLTAACQGPASSSAPQKRLSIADVGAVGDGTTLNTVAIQKGIDQLQAGGGGVLVIPAGKFRSGSIFLKPGVELYLDEGAVLFGSDNIEDYPKRETRIEGHFEPWRMALVNVQQMDHVRISGKGHLDGNGVTYWNAFWQRRKENPRCTNLEVERPRLLFIDRCKDVRVEGISLQDSGFWNLHVYNCNGVVIEGLRVTVPSAVNGLRGPSTDGMDIDSSQNVTIRKCYISVNDDNIAFKGTKGPLADKDQTSPAVENILVEDTEFGDGNGMTCGSEATLVRNITARRNTISGNATLLTLKLRPDTPQRYENILIEDIKLTGTGRILNVAPWLQFFDLKGLPMPTRSIRNVTIRNVSGKFGTMGTLRGNAGDLITGITLENIDLQLKSSQFALGPTENLQLKNVRVNGEEFKLPAVLPPPALPGSGPAAAAGTAPAARRQ